MPENDAQPPVKSTIEPDRFFECDLRVGVVRSAAMLEDARIPAIRMEIDFGPLGVRQSSARLTKRYKPEDLVGRRVVGVVNFPSRRVAGFKSEVLVLGAIPAAEDVSLLDIDHGDIPPGTPVA